MKVILFESVENVGLPGDVANVRPGYYRNFLGPRGVAVEATQGNLKMLELKRKNLQVKAEELRNQARSLGDRLQSVTVKFVLKVGDSNRLFGAVTNVDVADKLKELGFDIDRRRIAMPGVVKTTGTFMAKIKLEGNVSVPLQIIIEAEAAPVEPEEEPAYDEAEGEAEAAEEGGEE